ncbi:MAG: cytochrome c [Armatimonadetes bacterium]|nr:cytochrome c [Armatimonadota bacterium]
MKRRPRPPFWGAVLLALATTGCGNQMFRQPNYTPLDTPRAAPPADSVPVNAARAPLDGRAVVSAAYGADGTAAALQASASSMAAFPSREPDLPPPNLSDNARYEPSPASVDALKNPLPSDPRVVRAGRVLFLNRCVQCHNAEGYGYGTVGQYLVPHPPDLASPLVQKRTDGTIFWHITQGQGKMPGFRHWTTTSERWSLTAYVRSLKNAPKPSDPAAYQESTAIRNTPFAPYPVYGVSGFERGESAYPFKVLHPSTSSDTTAGGVQNQGFGQAPVGPR